MNKNKVRIQAVLYKNDAKDVIRSIESFIIAAKYSNTEIEFSYGDASPKPCINKETFEECEINSGISIEYNYFNENTGYGKGHNILADNANSEYILVTNPDIIVNESFFKFILDDAEKQNVGMVEARQTPLEHPKFYNPKTYETSWCSGACTLIKTGIYKLVDGFDWQTFWMYCEDVDISWRIRLLGYKLLHQPKAIAFHPKHLSNTAGWEPTETEQIQSAKANLLMAYKWSNDVLLKRLVKQYKKNNDQYQLSAIESFEDLKSSNNLPNRIKASAEITTFTEDYDYSLKRW